LGFFICSYCVFRKPKAATLFHDINLKKFFTLKISIWRRLRKAEIGSTHAVILKNHYKATCVRINATILDLCKKKNRRSRGQYKKFYNYVNSKLHTPHSITNMKDSEGSIGKFVVCGKFRHKDVGK